ncbi:gamma-glutamylcyclotransferase [Hydrogenimonas sp.]|uniref:gamma-glutamylcyclotransferase n=1 Tax=Hydrogenimonas sp. TaxID=2231112 RepID=UPI00262EDCBD|nr:gamma-glutamylcyclotransferase [Hydrogenimonas sp.]
MNIYLGAHPGLKEGAGEVRGELCRITDSRRLFLRCWTGTKGANTAEMVKEAVTWDGERIEAWVYLYLPPVREGRIIETGDYARFRGVRKI